MKKIIYLLIGFMFVSQAYAQNYDTENSSEFVLGNGLVINSGNDYHFKLSGLIQPTFSVLVDSVKTDYLFNAKHTFFSFSGFAKPEKVSFLMLADFSLTSPLLDAWVAYHINNNINLSFGQKLISGNNRAMIFKRDNLQFFNRSLLSTNFSGSGREFGLFLDLSLSFNRFNINPSFGITSGDGRSSFGTNSRDVD